MADEFDRLNRLLDDMIAGREPDDQLDLTAEERELLETALLLRSASTAAPQPDAEFVDALAQRLHQHSSSPAAPSASPAPTRGPIKGVSRRGLLGRLAGAAAGLAAGGAAGMVIRGEADEAAAADAYRRGKDDGYRRGQTAGFHTEVNAPYSAPLVPADRAQIFATGLHRDALPPGTAQRFRAGAIEGFVVNPGRGKDLYAVSAACTHMGCLLSWLNETSTFLCPCHGAQYNADGSVLSGIARHPLPHLAVQVDAQGAISVLSVDPHASATQLEPYTRE